MTPSYARPTRSSVARSNPPFPAPPKRLKRPSTLVDRTQRRKSSTGPLIIKAADSSKPCPLASLPPELSTGRFTIEAADRSKPCSLASLPPELRLRIYFYLLPKDFDCNTKSTYRRSKRDRSKSRWESLFRVCRLVHAEVTYEFYTKANFTLPSVSVDNYEALKTWLLSIPPAQRSALAKNPNLKLPLTLDLDYGIAGPEMLADSDMLWKLCERFGNVYALSQHRDRLHFLGFCKMASWWLWCAGPLSKDITWSYKIRLSDRYWGSRHDRRSADISDLEEWFSRVLQTSALPCVHTAWSRERREVEMKKEALNMLETVHQTMKLRRRKMRLPPSGVEDWNSRVALLRRLFNTW